MQIALIWAMSENGVIGNDGRLPWRLPAEMAHFKRVTMGHPVIMGRRTYQSMKKPLEGRTNIVLSRSRIDVPVGIHLVADFASALEVARLAAKKLAVDTVMIVGGAAVYAPALPQADVLHVTVVHAAIEGDTFFPAFDRAAFTEVSKQHVAADEKNKFGFTIYELRRKATAVGTSA